MYSKKDGNFVLCVLATLCIVGYGVSSWEACPIYIPHYCACEITDEAKSTLINMCYYEIDEDMGCKPCSSDFQDYANCTSCPGKTCPVCAPDEFDMQALQSVSLKAFKDLKKIGKIIASYSFKLADNSSIIYKTGEDQGTKTMNATEDDQNENEQIIYDKKQTSGNSIAFEDIDNSEEQISDENMGIKSFNLIKEDLNRNGFQISEKNQTSRNKNTTEEDQNNSEMNSSEQKRNTTDQYFSDEDYVLENINYVTGEKEKDDSYQTSANEQQNGTFNDQRFEMEANLNHSLAYTNDGLMSQKYGDVSYMENENGKTFINHEIIMNATEDDQNENEQIIYDKNQTPINSSAFGDADNSEEQISDENQGTRSLNLTKEDLNRNGIHIFEKNQTSRNKNTIEKDQNNTEMDSSGHDRNTTGQYFSDEDYGLEKIDFTLSSPEEMYFLRGENSKNYSSSKKTFNGFADKLQLENNTSEFENNYSRNVLNDEKNNKTEIEKESKLRSTHLTRSVDKDFSKNKYMIDVINNVFYDERNSTIQTLAFDVMFVNYLKYSTGMSDLTTFYFLTDLSPEEKVDINLVRICFLNQNYFTVTDSEFNLCRKGMVSIPDSSSLLTVRVQNSSIFKDFNYNIFDEESEHTSENQTLLDESSLSKNDGKSNIFNRDDYKLLRKGAKKFVNDNFEFRKLHDLWEMPENESSETYRFCQDINLVRVCKNYEDDLRVYLKFDDRFQIFVSAFLNSDTLLDLRAAEFVKMQLSKHNYLMPNTNAEPEEKEKTDPNNQTMNFMEMELSTSSYKNKHIGENKSLKITEDGFVESRKNLTEDSQNEFGNEKFDFNRSDTSKELNISSSVHKSTYNFSDETGNEDEVSLSVTRVNDTNEDGPSGLDGSQRDDVQDYIYGPSGLDGSLTDDFHDYIYGPSGLDGSRTDDVQDYILDLLQYDFATRLRRAAKDSKHSPYAWCGYFHMTFYGRIYCDVSHYEKNCTVTCFYGYDFDGEESKEFKCQRENNIWVPELTSCSKKTNYMNINEAKGLESGTDEVKKSHQEAKYENAHVPGDASTSFKDKSHNLLSNYHDADFNFDNYTYDKYNYDSPSDEYE